MYNSIIPFLVFQIFLCIPCFGNQDFNPASDSVVMHGTAKEVVVVGMRPDVEVTAEKTIINVGNSPLTSSGNAFSVLKNLPGVIIGSDGSILLNGESGVSVLIDGKTSYLGGTELLNYLMSIPASSLERVELIKHPSVKYDASGSGGIIDIYTKKNREKGFNMSINTNYEQGKYSRMSDNLSLNLHRNKLNIYGMYGYYKGHDFVDLTTFRDFMETTSVGDITFNQNSYRKRHDRNLYFNAGLDYFVSPKTTIEFAVKGNVSNRIENGTLSSYFYTIVGQNDSTIRSSTDNTNIRNNLISTLGFRYKIDSLGKELRASLDGLRYIVKENQEHDDIFSRQVGSSSQVSSRSQKDGMIGICSGRVDLIWPISDKLRFEAGAKTDFVDIDNTSKYDNKINDRWLADESLNSQFLYKENINAFYASTRIHRTAFLINAGIRIENTNIKGTFVSRTYTNLFPNISLGYQLQNKNSLDFIFLKRVDRPNYSYLNPFVYIFDTYTYVQGNTALKPQYTDRFVFSYLIRKNYSFSLFLSNTEKAIVKSYQIKENSKRLYVMPTNMASYRSFGFQGNVGQISVARWLKSGINWGITEKAYKWEENGTNLQNKKANLQFGLNNRISLPWSWSAEISGFYNGKMAFGQIDILPVWQISGGLKKNLCHGNATLNIFSNDWFNSNKFRGELNLSSSRASTEEFQDRSIFGVSFSYRFKKGSDAKKNGEGSRFYDSKRVNL